MRRFARPAAVVAAVVAASLVPLGVSTFGLDIATSIVVFSILAVGLNLVVMQSGLPSLGHAAFFGVGAYSVALLAEQDIFNPAVVLAVSVLGATLLAAVLGPILLRTRDEYFLMATLALGEILRNVSINWRSFTGGDDGLFGPLRPTVFGLSLTENIPFYYAALASLVVITLLAWALTRSPFGHTMRAARDNRRRVSALGIPTARVEYVTLVASAAIAGFAGMMFAYSNTFVAPSVFSLEISGTVLLMVVLFNSASVFAAVAGAVVIEGIRGAGSHYTDRWMLILGFVYILISIDAPRRLLGRRTTRIVGDDAGPGPGLEQEPAAAGAGAAPGRTP